MGLHNFRPLAEALPEVFEKLSYDRHRRDVVGLGRALVAVAEQLGTRYILVDATSYLGKYAHSASYLSRPPFVRNKNTFLDQPAYRSALSDLRTLVLVLRQLLPTTLVSLFFDGHLRSLSKLPEQTAREQANTAKLHARRADWQSSAGGERGRGDLLFEVPPPGVADIYELPATSAFSAPPLNRGTLGRAARINSDAAWLLDPANGVIVLDAEHEADPAIPGHLRRLFASPEECIQLQEDILDVYINNPPYHPDGTRPPLSLETTRHLFGILTQFASFHPANVLPIGTDSDIHLNSSSALSTHSLTVHPPTRTGSHLFLCDRTRLEPVFGGLPASGVGGALIALLVGQDYSGGGLVGLGPHRLLEHAARIGHFCRLDFTLETWPTQLESLVTDLNNGRSTFALSPAFPAAFPEARRAVQTFLGLPLPSSDLFSKRDLQAEIWRNSRTPSQHVPPLLGPAPAPPAPPPPRPRGLRPEQGAVRPAASGAPPQPLHGVDLYLRGQLSPTELHARRRRAGEAGLPVAQQPLPNRVASAGPPRVPGPQLVHVRQLPPHLSPLSTLYSFLDHHPHQPVQPDQPDLGDPVGVEQAPDAASANAHGSTFPIATYAVPLSLARARRLLEPCLFPLLGQLHRVFAAVLVPLLHLIVPFSFGALSAISPFHPSLANALAHPHDFLRSLLRIFSGSLDRKGTMTSTPRMRRLSLGYGAGPAEEAALQQVLAAVDKEQLACTTVPAQLFHALSLVRTDPYFASHLDLLHHAPIRNFMGRTADEYADALAAKLINDTAMPKAVGSLFYALLSDPQQNTAQLATTLQHHHHAFFPPGSHAQPPPPSALLPSLFALITPSVQHLAPRLAFALSQSDGLLGKIFRTLAHDAFLLGVPLSLAAASRHIPEHAAEVASSIRKQIYFALLPAEMTSLTVVVQLVMAALFDLARTAVVATVAHQYDVSISPGRRTGLGSAYHDERDAPFRTAADGPPLPSAWSNAELCSLANRALLLCELDSSAVDVVNRAPSVLPFRPTTEELVALKQMVAVGAGAGFIDAERRLEQVAAEAELLQLARGNGHTPRSVGWLSGSDYVTVGRVLRGGGRALVGWGEAAAARVWLEGFIAGLERLRINFFPVHLSITFTSFVTLLASFTTPKSTLPRTLASSVTALTGAAPPLAWPPPLADYLAAQANLALDEQVDHGALDHLVSQLFDAYGAGSDFAAVAPASALTTRTPFNLTRVIEAGSRLPALRLVFPGLAPTQLAQGSFSFSPSALHVQLLHAERVTEKQLAGLPVRPQTIGAYLHLLVAQPSSSGAFKLKVLTPLFKLASLNAARTALRNPTFFPPAFMNQPLRPRPLLPPKSILPSLPELRSVTAPGSELHEFLDPASGRLTANVRPLAFDGGYRETLYGISDGPLASSGTRTAGVKKGIFLSAVRHRQALRAVRFPADDVNTYFEVDMGRFEKGERETSRVTAYHVQPGERARRLAAFDAATAAKHASLYDRVAQELARALVPPLTPPHAPLRVLIFFGLGNVARPAGSAASQDLAVMRRLVVALRVRPDVQEVKVLGVDEFRTSSVCPNLACYGTPDGRLLAHLYADNDDQLVFRLKMCESCGQIYHRDHVGATGIFHVGVATAVRDISHLFREPFAEANGLVYPPKRPEPQPPLRPSS